MTQSVPHGAVATAPPQMTIDQALLRLSAEIEQYIQQMAARPNPTPQQLNQSITGTVLSLLRDLAGIVLFDHRAQLAIAGDLDRRMNEVEELAIEAAEDGFDPELARRIVLCASGCMLLAQKELERETDPEVRKQLQEQLDQAALLRSEFTGEGDEDEDDEDDAEDEAEDQPGAEG